MRQSGGAYPLVPGDAALARLYLFVSSYIIPQLGLEMNRF